MKAMILCAGKGERLRPLTNEIPKPLVPINNRPVLEYLVLLCRENGIKDIAINTSYLPEKIRDYFGNGERFGVNIKYSTEKSLLGTAGALNNFRDFFGDTFFVLYGDNITNLNLEKMLEFHRAKKAKGTVYLYHQDISDEKTTPGVVLLDRHGRVTHLIENPNAKEIDLINNTSPKNRFTNSGIYILEAEVLSFIPEGYSDFSKDIFPQIIKQKEVYGFTDSFYIREVGQLMRYKLAKEEIESGRVKLNYVE